MNKNIRKAVDLFKVKTLTDCMEGFSEGDLVTIDRSYDELGSYSLRVCKDEFTGYCDLDHLLIVQESNLVIEIPEETYQELLETERKYLILLEEVKNLSKNLENYQESLENILKTLKKV